MESWKSKETLGNASENPGKVYPVNIHVRAGVCSLVVTNVPYHVGF